MHAVALHMHAVALHMHAVALHMHAVALDAHAQKHMYTYTHTQGLPSKERRWHSPRQSIS